MNGWNRSKFHAPASIWHRMSHNQTPSAEKMAGNCLNRSDCNLFAMLFVYRVREFETQVGARNVG